MTSDDIRSELRILSAALLTQLESLKDSGATGLELANADLLAARSAAQEIIAVEPIAAALPSLLSVKSAEPDTEILAPHTGEAAAPYGPINEAARIRLDVLASEAKACTRCRLHEKRIQAVFARGQGHSGLCFVGEGPGADEDAQGFPFVGKAGQLLDRMIAAMKLDRNAVYVCNVVKCRPPDNRKPEIDEIAACSSFLHEQLELIRPQVIVALGASAVQGLLGTTEGITRMRGRWKLYRGKIPVMPTFHPAYLLRQPSAKRDVWEDLQAVLERMGRPVPSQRG